MLLIAAYFLGDSNRWWTQHGQHLPDGPDLGEVYRLLHQISIEAEASWSLLPDQGNGTRIFSIRTALLRVSLLLMERGEDVVVIDNRIPPEHGGQHGHRHVCPGAARPASAPPAPTHEPAIMPGSSTQAGQLR